MSKVLILGGTGEARELAAQLHAQGVEIISALAGRVSKPRLPVGLVRIGGFGGPQGLASWLTENQIARVVDATHPFAENISRNAAIACGQIGVPLLRLARPGWADQDPGSWIWVDGLDHAASTVTELADRKGQALRVFLTSGRQGLASFAGDYNNWFLIRCVDPPEVDLPAKHQLLLARGPYTEQSELQLMADHKIDLLVSKDSGGDLTAGKLAAAQQLDVQVVMVNRPVAQASVKQVSTVAEAIAFSLLGRKC